MSCQVQHLLLAVRAGVAHPAMHMALVTFEALTHRKKAAAGLALKPYRNKNR